jgi:hypothetical protein
LNLGQPDFDKKGKFTEDVSLSINFETEDINHPTNDSTNNL